MSRPTAKPKFEPMKAYARWLTRVPQRRLLSFNCPGCGEQLKTAREPGDTICVCPFCGVMFFKITHVDGRVEALSDLEGALS